MVTFETKCYENDFQLILKSSYLKTMIERCNYKFDKKVLFINNVSDINKVKKYADKAVSKGIIDEFYVVKEYAQPALDFFEIDKESFMGGYYYSISELVSIFLCKTEYLVHFSSDVMMFPNSVNWIDDAIYNMKNNKKFVVANPNWSKDYKGEKIESYDESENWFIGTGFSDQCYLIKTDVFKNNIYNFHHEYSERYPRYGGELFEKRVDAYMRFNNLYRLTNKNCFYMHKNIPKGSYLKQLIWYYRNLLKKP
jgi:hypothetical protein